MSKEIVTPRVSSAYITESEDAGPSIAVMPNTPLHKRGLEYMIGDELLRMV